MQTNITQLAEFIESLLRRSATTLTPDRAIMLECAFEAETDEYALAVMKEKILRFNRCAEKGLPLRHGYEHIEMTVYIGKDAKFGFTEDDLDDAVRKSAGMPWHTKTVIVPGGGVVIEAGILDSRTLKSEMTTKSRLLPGDAGFDELIADAVLEMKFVTEPPVIIGAGIAAVNQHEDFDEDDDGDWDDDDDDVWTARERAYSALLRPIDAASSPWLDRERRILARINREGSFGRHTALAVNIAAGSSDPADMKRPVYICVLAADCLTCAARGTLKL